jgi:hypothetical protein
MSLTTNIERCVFRQQNLLPSICIGYNNEFQVKGRHQYFGEVPGEIQTDNRYKCNDSLQPVRNSLEQSLNIYFLLLEKPLANFNPISLCHVSVPLAFFSSFRRILE